MAYPWIWALKHAPTADIYEQMILVIMADAADEDGCNSYRSKARIAELANNVDERTVVRKWRAMEKRGLIRVDTTPPPPRYLKIPKNRRPKRWELCIPFSWWSPAQMEEIQRGREDRCLEPLTPQNRPDITAVPPTKTERSDKGKPNPKRSRKRATSTDHPSTEEGVPWGDSETPQGTDGWGVSQSPPGVSDSHPQGCLSDTQPSPYDRPHVPSSPPAPPAAENTTGPNGEGNGREEENPTETEDPEGALERAEKLVEYAVRLWPSNHRAPNPRDRRRLCERVAAELDAGGDETVIVHEMSRDLRDAGGAVNVVLGSRTREPGWGRSWDPRPAHSRYQVKTKAPWCGQCVESVRLVQVYDPSTGDTRPGRCRNPVQDVDGRTVACHPMATPREELQGENFGDIEDLDDQEVLERMRESLQGQGAADEAAGGPSPGARTAREIAEEARKKAEEKRQAEQEFRRGRVRAPAPRAAADDTTHRADRPDVPDVA